MALNQDACSLSLSTCQRNLTNILGQYDACMGAATTSCSTDVPQDYDMPLHIASVFIILIVSMLGSGIPVLSKYFDKACGIDPYVFALGKHIGTGIVLACALIHMLQPAASSLTNLCVPAEFNSNYTAYAYLYCMLAGLFMHFFESMMALYRRNIKASSSKAATDVEETAVIAVGHTHGLSVDEEHLIQMYSMEFALTVHSVFIGLTVGIVGAEELKTLLVALSFHQMFEGVALGARLADATITMVQKVLFIVIFSLSSPVGIAAGIGASSTVNVSGVTYLLTEGTFDGICAGILLYVGYQLLMHDFAVESERYCAGQKNEMVRRAGMFIALWVGAGFMAFIGRYL